MYTPMAVEDYILLDSTRVLPQPHLFLVDEFKSLATRAPPYNALTSQVNQASSPHKTPMES